MDFDISDNLKYNVLGRCEHPKYIKNKYTGELVEVPCGKCNKCLLNKCNSGMLLCSIEEAYHRYCYFVTLTYADEHLPVVFPEVFDTSVNLLGEPAGSQNFSFFTTTKRVIKEFGTDVLHQGIYDVEYITKYMERLKVRQGGIPFLFYKDIQLYVKRVRKHLAKISTSPIRYYAVGEYGPKTFRPHWHLLFFFDDRQQASYFSQVAVQCWKYGRVDYSVSRHSTASYLAGYVNNYSCVPSILQARPFRPKAFHSARFGFAPFEGDKEKIYQDPFAYLNDKSIKLFNGVVSAQFFNRLRCHLFPRCPRFSDKTIATRRNFYIFTYRIKSLVPDIELRSMYRYLRDLFFDENLKHCSLPVACQVRFVVRSLFVTYSHTPDLISNEEYFEQFVKRAIYMSNHFLNFICDGNIKIANERLRQIDDFYKVLSMRTLFNWYSAMQEYIEHYGDDANLSPFYFENAIGFSDDCKDNLIPLVEQLKFDYAERIHNRQKHRILNDANKIFIINGNK